MNHRLVPGQWKQGVNMHNMKEVTGCNSCHIISKMKHLLLNTQ